MLSLSWKLKTKNQTIEANLSASGSGLRKEILKWSAFCSEKDKSCLKYGL